MGNDPAVLFYTSDFLTGTRFMTHEQIGKYITLLCLQHQQGHLTEEDMLKICERHDERIFKKFEIDENGLYFNVRMDKEIAKRHAYSESRRNNRMSNKGTTSIHMSNTCKSYEEHMENENEDVNKDIDIEKKRECEGEKGKKRERAEKKKFIPPTLEEIQSYCTERNSGVDPKKFFDYYETSGWVDAKGQKVRNWKQKLITWEGRNTPKPKKGVFEPI
jgi:uncharacterized protein YdaU (DUF1376 family)